MTEKPDKLDRLFKGYYKSKRMPPPASMPMPDMICEKRIEMNYCSSIESSPKMIKGPCPELSSVSAYIEGVLDDVGKAAIDAHTKHCKKCRGKIESGLLFMKQVKEDRLAKTPENISLDISSKLSDFLRKNKPSKEK